VHIGYDDQAPQNGGSGDVIVLVHGQVEHFGQTHRVIAPDLRGYGESTVVPGKTTLDVFANDIRELLDRLNVDKIVLGGLSMGGQIVMAFHSLFPDRVKALMLADTFPGLDTPAARQLRLDTADRLEREGMGPYADEVIWKMVAPYNKDAAEHVLKMMRGAPPEGAAAALRGRAERPDYTESLRTIGVPTLIVVGRDDEYTPVSEAERMRDLVPGAELVVVEGAAHMPNLERQAIFDRAFQRFLKTVG
jgi:3-oxoadipate enol-lactonase